MDEGFAVIGAHRGRDVCRHCRYAGWLFLLVENAVGVLGLLVLLLKLLTPLLRTVAALFLYRSASAVLQPVADDPLCRCIGEFGEVFSLLFIIELSVGAMFMLLCAEMLTVGTMTVMLR